MSETALITGASGGIGLDLAREFAKRSYNLVLVARSADKLQAATDELRRHDIRVDAIVRDLAETSSAQALLTDIEHLGVTVDIIVNNAGYGAVGSFSELDCGNQIEMIQLNVSTLVALTRLLLPGMIARRRGRVLNVASTAAFQPGPFMAVYYATKSFVLSFSEALGEELSGTGVIVTTLCPGPVITGFAERAGAQKTNLFKSSTLVSSAEVARIGVEGCLAGKSLVIPGHLNRLMAFSTRFAPRKMLLKIVRRMQQT